MTNSSKLPEKIDTSLKAQLFHDPLAVEEKINEIIDYLASSKEQQDRVHPFVKLRVGVDPLNKGEIDE